MLAVGASNTVRASAGPDSRIIDLNGYTIVPGFIDTHPHLLHFGTLAEPLVDLGDARSHDDIADRIAARAARVPPGEWIMTTPVGEPHYFIRRSYREPTGRLHGSVTNYYCDSDFWNSLLRQLPLAAARCDHPWDRGRHARRQRGGRHDHLRVAPDDLLAHRDLPVAARPGPAHPAGAVLPGAEPSGVPWTDPLQAAGYLQRLQRARDITDRSDDLFRIDGVTVSPYGPCWPGFALMREPYLDPYGI